MKKEKINLQKLFCIITCCIFYGTRFVKLYLENEKQVIIEKNTLAKNLKENNINILKNINGEYYFSGNVENNYVIYSNILWRAIKIGENNIVTLISDHSLTSIAFGEDKNYEESYIHKWLNESDDNYSGILERNLNSMVSYLKDNNLCNDKINDVNNLTCENINNNYPITLLSINDYINTGASNSFINSSENFYLSNLNDNNEVWYVNTDGKLNTSDGNDIYGVKPVITFKENIDLVSGKGTKEDPYVIESNIGLFGSYVSLEEDIYRVIDINGEELKLMYNNYLSDNNDIVSYRYSNHSSKYDDKKYNTLAYYLNNTFLNKLSYKDKIIETNYSNGYYGKENNFDYANTYENMITTKVALVNIGDIILNNDLSNYFTLTSSSKNNNFIYTIQKDANPYSKIISSASYIVPVITINKNDVEGIGTLENPLRLVNDNE